MKKVYDIRLLPGEHGIWLFVSADGILLNEQSSLKTVEQALAYAKGFIEAEEKMERK